MKQLTEALLHYLLELSSCGPPAMAIRWQDGEQARHIAPEKREEEKRETDKPHMEMES